MVDSEAVKLRDISKQQIDLEIFKITHNGICFALQFMMMLFGV